MARFQTSRLATLGLLACFSLQQSLVQSAIAGLSDADAAIVSQDLGLQALGGAVQNAAVAAAANSITGGKSTSLGQGLSWDFGSKGMIETLTGFFMNYMTGQSDPNSALNVYGSALLSQDPVQVAAAMGKLLTSLDLTCAFQMTSGGDGVNMKFRDGREALHIQFIPSTSATVFNFKGTFPKSRAFSYSTYAISNQKVQYVDTINDVDIVPDTGVNPFVQGPGLLQPTGTYDLYVTPDGKQGYANELKSFTAGKATNDLQGIVIVYRVVMADGVMADGWGGVVAPTLRIKTFNVLATGLWLNMAQCNPKNNDVIAQFVKDKFNFQEGVSDVKVSCDVFNMDNNFVYYDDAQYFRSPDENHIISCASKKLLPAGSDIITMIAGTIPAATDSRYTSISLVDLYPPGANIYTVSDQALRQFYWQQGKSAVNYTVIMAKSKLTLQRCGLTKLPSNWYQVYWGGMTNAAISSYPGIVYREIETSDTQEALEQVRYACESAMECNNPKFFEGLMGDFYPRISYLMCNADGTIAPAPNANATFADPSLPTPAPKGIWESLMAVDELGAATVPLAKVNVSALAGSEVWVDGTLIQKVTDSPKVVTQNLASQAWSPIQAVYYNPEDNTTTPSDSMVRAFMDQDGAEVQVELIPTPADFLPEETVIALKVPITGNAQAFFATLNICGYQKASAAGWKCKATSYTDGNWTLPTFDDKDWLPALVSARSAACNALKSDCTYLPADAQGIWVDSCTGSAAATSGDIYCRLTLPQQCDLSNVNGAVDKVSARCSDKNNVAATARFASPTLYWVYANGVEVGGDQSMTQLDGKGSTFGVSKTAPTIALAFKAVDDTHKAFKSFLKGEVNICGEVYTTNGDWKCAPNEPRTNDWTKAGFDDSTWVAVDLKDGAPWEPNEPSGISKGASWVWTQSTTTDAYCRIEFPNPIYVKPTNVVISP